MNLNILKKKEATKKVKLSLREKKHQANLQKNNGLYFQIGLIATLFIVFGVFQLKFDKQEIAFNYPEADAPIELNTLPPDYIIEEDMPKKVKEEVVRVQPKSFQNPKIVDDNDKVLDDLIKTSPVVFDKPIEVVDIDVVDVDPVVTIPISLVSDYPVYPGCDKFEDKKSLMECFQQKIANHINRKFDSDVAVENGLSGKQKIMIMFTINHEGDIVSVKARAPHPELQKEAVSVVNSLPKMKPAMQGYKKVNVTYSLPVIFEVE